MKSPDEHCLVLTLANVRRNVEPSATAPYWEPGGDWTFFDAILEGDPRAAFSVGLGPLKAGFGKLRLVPAGVEKGRRLVAALARALEIDEPPAARAVALAPIEFGYTGLGQRGTLHETKWFPAVDGVESEVFFNFDLDRLKGELLEKDASYNPSLLEVFATALRDGRAPDPTPDTDPRISATGPSFDDVRRFGAAHTLQLQQLFETAAVFIERDGAGDRLVSFDLETAQRTELARVGRGIKRAVFAGGELPRWLLHEGARNQHEPSAFWLLESVQLSCLHVGEPARSPGLARVPLSPDGRYLALEEWAPCVERRGNYAYLHFIDRKTENTITVRVGEASLSVVDWSVEKDKPLAVVQAISGPHRNEQKQALDVEPDTGKVTPSSRALVPDGARGIALNPLAPDARRRATLQASTLTVEDVRTSSRRTLELGPPIAENPSPSQFHWVSPRYLIWKNQFRVAFIDSDTGKMSFPLPRDDGRSVSVAPGFRNALLVDDGAWFVARIVCPREP